VGLEFAAAAEACVGIIIPRSDDRGKDMGDGEWMKESRFGVAATGPGVVGREGPLGRRLKRSRENCD
jgi:hypothetical protein